MRLAGYIPNTDFVLQDVNEEDKQGILCNHNEKLFIAFGILISNGESSTKVFKNLRICCRFRIHRFKFPTTSIRATVDNGSVKSLQEIVWRTKWYWDDDSWLPSIGLANEIRFESGFELSKV
ncbi:hypothetical protein Dsin_016057 [Dipteronia sinensis]|uniref:DYW domain-containing protein n=1 Tax=Dipteronia sinensis TaxID=43782 RepID=A0AAE0AD00_9ROSI|nr:hypothetical protein Dsin_016057 [Dipteronia sinensis]